MPLPDGTPTDAELAAELGMTQQGLSHARRAGRCSRSKDIEVLRRELAENTDPRMQRKKTKTGTATGALALHRARYEAARAREKELRVKQLEGSLVDRQKASALFFDLGRRVREAWERWPPRVAAQVAAELGADPHQVERVLTRHVKEHLRQIPQDLRARFR